MTWHNLAATSIGRRHCKPRHRRRLIFTVPKTTVLLWTTPLGASTSRLRPPSVSFPQASSQFAPLLEDHKAMDYDEYGALLHDIFRQVHRRHLTFRAFVSSYFVLQAQEDACFKPSAEREHPRRSLPSYPNRPIPRVIPHENRFLKPFEAAVCVLNPVVAVKVRSAAVHVALSTV